MFCLLLFGFVASVVAGPVYYGHIGSAPYVPDYGIIRGPYFAQGSSFEPVFDTNRFWADLSKEMKELNDWINDFSRRFASSRSQVKFEGNVYKITIPLSGYEEKDIIVKARDGLVMIQACHEHPSGSQNSYLDIRTLPEEVSSNGTWIYDKSVLTIMFPLKEGVTTEQTVNVMSTEFTTRFPNLDREEIEENGVNVDNENADVGLDRGDQAKETELLTNVIPDRDAVEATTYAVDLKDEVEFVPVRF